AISEAGYEAEVRQSAEEAGPHEPPEHRQSGWERNLWIGVLCTLPLMLGEWVFGWGMAPWFQWLAFGLASIVQFLSGAQFYRGAWNQLRSGHSNMDTLVALGSTTAYGYSLWALFSGGGGHLYFMEAAA